jgi:hypothetical protein
MTKRMFQKSGMTALSPRAHHAMQIVDFDREDSRFDTSVKKL